MDDNDPSLPHLTRETVALVRALLERDPDTGEHCDRTHALALELGRAVALPAAALCSLGLAAQLHDIGKIGIPDRVLLKQGRLESDELLVMKTHPQRGHDILAVVPDATLAVVAEAVLRHHEGYDGNGYPGGLKGEAIPVLARIISIVDSYDAMATDRPYHRAKDHAAIMEVLHETNSGKYDPYLLGRFAGLIERSAFRSRGSPLA
ncbi:HD-GYP domain-containing protein [Rivibacter subsaxonicus]|uniref:HD domain-containing protein n=1 Tax=Rivibacter subsaxonicus TaxID=457575 RepID=A0A4Q7VZT2_9BURK|nr:HD domain-containing phosphohydrolase [Rivibacter subsaxonicus]RZU02442.1 HD domain-containing protein [Rivibacter subsaxonicus]